MSAQTRSLLTAEAITPSEPQALASTQARMATVLKLHTAGRANRAHLIQDDPNGVFLCFRGMRYGVDDYVPTSLSASRSSSPTITAGEFVCRQMLRQHGPDEDGWPVLARQFLMNHATVKPHRPDAVKGRRFAT